MSNKYDIFISYRHETHGGWVLWIQEILKKKEYNIFWDYPAMKAGNFPKQLEDAIKKSNVIIFLCSQAVLKGCKRKDDEIASELLIAHKNDKIILPISTDIPTNALKKFYPKKLAFLKYNEAIELQVKSYNSFFEAVTSRIDGAKPIDIQQEAESLLHAADYGLMSPYQTYLASEAAWHYASKLYHQLHDKNQLSRFEIFRTDTIKKLSLQDKIKKSIYGKRDTREVIYGKSLTKF